MVLVDEGGPEILGQFDEILVRVLQFPEHELRYILLSLLMVYCGLLDLVFEGFNAILAMIVQIYMY